MIPITKSSNVNGTVLEEAKLSTDRLSRTLALSQALENIRIRAAHIYTRTNHRKLPNRLDIIKPPPNEEVHNKKSHVLCKGKSKLQGKSRNSSKARLTRRTKSNITVRRPEPSYTRSGIRKQKYPSRVSICSSRILCAPPRSVSLGLIRDHYKRNWEFGKESLRQKSSIILSNGADGKSNDSSMQRKKRASTPKGKGGDSAPGGGVCNCAQNGMNFDSMNKAQLIQLQCQQQVQQQVQQMKMQVPQMNPKKKGMEKYICTCQDCGNVTNCYCVEDLDAIEEEQEPEMQPVKKVTGKMQQYPPAPACDEEDPCSEFLDIMRDSMEDAVKRSLEETFAQCFCPVLQKLDTLCSQMERNACVLGKIYADLNDKISYYGERNAQQFQYLCVRMEHDRLFYQQQQEYYLNACKRSPSESGPCNGGGGNSACGISCSPDGSDQGASVSCHVQKISGRCNVSCGEKHLKTSSWECQLTDDTGDADAQTMSADESSKSSPMRGSKSTIGKSTKSGDDRVKKKKSDTSTESTKRSSKSSK